MQYVRCLSLRSIIQGPEAADLEWVKKHEPEPLSRGGVVVELAWAALAFEGRGDVVGSVVDLLSAEVVEVVVAYGEVPGFGAVGCVYVCVYLCVYVCI